MTRASRIGVLTVVTVLTLSACSSLGGGGGPAGADEISARVDGTGIAPELVYVTDVDGFDLMTQSVGVWGTDGMSALYLSDDGGSVMLTTARAADPTTDPCTDLPDAAEAVLRCSVERGGVHVVLESQGVEPATLGAAAEAVRVPGAEELDGLFVDLPVVEQTPVERGDLPAEGDGAPNNDVGVGG